MRVTVRTFVAAATLTVMVACGGQDDVATVEPGASSSVAPSDTRGVTELSITTSSGAEGAVADQQTHLLTCEPVGGDHPDPEAACAVLDEVGTEVFAAPPKDQMCTEQYGGPQTASVTGVVAGEPVQATFDRTNGCGISRWDAVAPVLAVELGGPES